MRVIIDIEANGLLHQATVMYCLVGKNIDTGEVFKAYPGMSTVGGLSWETYALAYLDNCNTIIAHNGTTFDLPFLKKMFEWTPSPTIEIIDTLVMSRHLNADRARVEGSKGGPHSVESWGLRLGRWKPDHTDWSVFSPEMLHRCVEDVEIQHLIYLELCKEADIIDPKGSIFDTKSYGPNNWSQSIRNEHMSAQIMFEQEENGCYFNKEKAEEHLVTLDNYIKGIEDDILAEVPATPKQKGVSVTKPFKKNGELSKAVIDWYPHLEHGHDFLQFDDPEDYYMWPDVRGPFSRVEWHSLNLGSDVQVKRWLDTLGWVPTQYNYSTKEFEHDGKPKRTSPKLTPDSFDSLPAGLGDKLKRRGMASHRRSQIAGWLGHLRDNGRVGAGANPQGTNTGRMKHRRVVNVPKANIYENKKDPSDPRNGHPIYFPEKQDIFFGTEMRDLFCAAPNKVLVCADAAGLELRCLAHYMNDPEYTRILLEEDIHTHNQELAGLPTRASAKGMIYASNYGAGPEKLGSLIDPNATVPEKVRLGKEMSARFLEANPALAKLIKEVKKASRRGWLRGLDGRKVMMRSFDGRVQEHKALNTLLQSAGSVVMTEARVWVAEQLRELGMQDRCLKVWDMHDEMAFECSPEDAPKLCELLERSIERAGEVLNFNLPLAGEAKVGQSWTEVH